MTRGDDLLSHTLSRTVQSALRGLTSVFGMGTGGTPAVRSPQDQHSALSRQHLAKPREWNALNLSLRGASQVLRRVGPRKGSFHIRKDQRSDWYLVLSNWYLAGSPWAFWPSTKY